MRLARRLLAVLLTAAVLCCAVTASSGSTSHVYFMAVNEKFIETTPANMPMVVGGVLYVPYTMLSTRDTSINMGVSAQYSSSRRTVLVSDGRQAVTFDFPSNTAYDPQGNYVNAQAIMRNSMAFLPLAWICNYFGTISYTTSSTPYGTLVRIINSSVILSDAAFIDAADGMLRSNLASYQQAIAAQQQPSTSPAPQTSGQPESGPQVYLAFLWGDGVEGLLETLDAIGYHTVFFFSPDQLAQQGNLVRQLVGAGHWVALDLPGSTVEECTQQAQQGSRLLADIAFCPTYIVRAEGLETAQREQLAQEGWAVWSPTHHWAEISSTYQLLSQLDSTRPNYVEIACSQDLLPSLSSALGSLDGNGYRLHQTVAPALSPLHSF